MHVIPDNAITIAWVRVIHGMPEWNRVRGLCLCVLIEEPNHEERGEEEDKQLQGGNILVPPIHLALELHLVSIIRIHVLERGGPVLLAALIIILSCTTTTSIIIMTITTIIICQQGQRDSPRNIIHGHIIPIMPRSEYGSGNVKVLPSAGDNDPQPSEGLQG